MGTILADGQCHYAFHVETRSGMGTQVVETLAGWKQAARARLPQGFGVSSVQELCDRVADVPGVARVLPTGPRSALPLALRMACGLTGIKGVLASHTGTGALSDAIRGELAAWGIDYLGLQQLGGDMPAAFMVHDPAMPSEHMSVEVRPLPATSYKHRSTYPSNVLRDADAMLLNRVNEGVLSAARLMKEAHKPNCLRIHGYSRHVHLDDYRPLFPLIDHVVVDAGHGSLRETAAALGLNPPRGWPDTGAFRTDYLKSVADALDIMAGRSLLHIYYINTRGTLYVFGAAGRSVVSLRPVVPPGEMCDLRTTARTHGAALAAALLDRQEFDMDGSTFQPKSQEGLDRFAHWIFRAAHHGILNVPWRWPDTAFDPSSMKTRLP